MNLIWSEPFADFWEPESIKVQSSSIAHVQQPQFQFYKTSFLGDQDKFNKNKHFYQTAIKQACLQW